VLSAPLGSAPLRPGELRTSDVLRIAASILRQLMPVRAVGNNISVDSRELAGELIARAFVLEELARTRETPDRFYVGERILRAIGEVLS